MAIFPTEATRAANLGLIEALSLDPTTVEDPEAPFTIRDGRLTYTQVDVFAGEIHRQSQTIDVPADVADHFKEAVSIACFAT